MRLIDADVLLDKFLRAYTAQEKKGNFQFVAAEVKQHFVDMICNTPSIDAVPVVRCGECRKWNSDPDSYGRSDGPKGKCMKTFEVTSDDDFCSYGERKDGAE